MTEPQEEDADTLARRVAAAMYDRDRAAHTLGAELLEIRVGYARVAMTVRDDMLNGHGSCHGGFVFALADTAFAYACNGRNRVNVALQCSISFAAPSIVGARLEAIAVERSVGGRTATYDVDVVAAGGAPVAFFRGTSYRVDASVV